jgi:glycerate 2-kinase
MTGTAELRADALALYGAALAGADPRAPLLNSLAGVPRSTAPLWILAIGKAAHPMAAAAADAARNRRLAGGLIVPPGSTPDVPGLCTVVGDHPLPAGASQHAARAVGALAARTAQGDEVWLLLSGGASSLVAAPERGINPDDFAALWRLLYGAGLPIGELNLIRKRWSRWGAGRLALALEHCTVRTFADSDVPGDDPETIGSGPAEPDTARAADVRRLLERNDLYGRVPQSLRDHLAAQDRGEIPETPKSDHAAFRAGSGARIIASNATALDAAEAAAVARGFLVFRQGEPLAGEAAAFGERVGDTMTAEEAAPRQCLLWGGETVVTLPADTQYPGGRSQELALAAAGALARRAGRTPVVVLAGSTDGRDGPTDTAGAVVDAGTWDRCRTHGIDPASAVARHDAYAALEASGDLIRTGMTGTNVMDVVIGLR